MLGIFLIVVVFALTLPLTLPRLMGYEVFDVISGSMEPAIPMGSVIYVRSAEPEDVQVDDVIAFMDDGSVVAHRVVANRTSMGEFVTKGDANNTEDLFPVPYDALLGVVALHVPMAGAAMSLYSSPIGKMYLVMALACGIMLNVLADHLRSQRSEQVRKRVQDGQITMSAAHAAPIEEERAPRRRTGTWIRTVAMCVLALVFLGSGGVVFYDEEAGTRRYGLLSASGEIVGSGYLSLRRTGRALLTAETDEWIGLIRPDGTVIMSLEKAE